MIETVRCYHAVCDMCDAVYDEPGEGYHLHQGTPDELRAYIVDDGWIVRDDGTVICYGCAEALAAETGEPRVNIGDTITSVARLRALDTGTVVLDALGCAWQRTNGAPNGMASLTCVGDTEPMPLGDGDYLGRQSARTQDPYSPWPFTVVHMPENTGRTRRLPDVSFIVAHCADAAHRLMLGELERALRALDCGREELANVIRAAASPPAERAPFWPDAVVAVHAPAADKEAPRA